MSNFERQIKQQGDGFSIEPGAQVWNRVEAELDKKKKRRIAGWWWFAPLAMLIAGSILYTSLQQKNSIAAKPMITEIKKNNDTNTQADSDKNKTPTISKTITTKVIKKQSFIDPAANNIVRLQHPINKTATVYAIKNNYKHTPAQAYSNFIAKTVDRETAKVSLATVAATPAVKENNYQATSSKDKQKTTAVSERVLESGINQPAVDKEIILEKKQGVTGQNESSVPDLSKDSTETKLITSTAKATKQNSLTAEVKMPDIKKPVENETTWMLFLSGGLSSNTKNDLSLSKADRLSYINDPQNSSNGGNLNMAIPLQPNKAGFSFAAGLQRRQWLGKRWQWQAGLCIQYQQIKQYTGIRKDSTINQSISNDYNVLYYYSGGKTLTHTGKNLRASLSNDMAFSLLKNKRILFINGGFYTGFNLSNNYLIPDDYNRRYLKLNSAYNTWFLGVDIGLEYRTQKGMSIGLKAKHDLTKSFTTIGGDNQYWNSLLLNVGIPLKIH